MAEPPAASISATTLSAAADRPVPSTVPPASLTSTFAPRAARPSAWQRPSPLPAPVTMATRSSKRMVAITPLRAQRGERGAQPARAGRVRCVSAFRCFYDLACPPHPLATLAPSPPKWAERVGGCSLRRVQFLPRILDVRDRVEFDIGELAVPHLGLSDVDVLDDVARVGVDRDRAARAR